MCLEAVVQPGLMEIGVLQGAGALCLAFLTSSSTAWGAGRPEVTPLCLFQQVLARFRVMPLQKLIDGQRPGPLLAPTKVPFLSQISA